MVLSGKDKGKSGTITRALPKLDRVVIDGINMRTKHQKKKSEREMGQIIQVPAPIHVSNVRLASIEKKPKVAKPRVRK